VDQAKRRRVKRKPKDIRKSRVIYRHARRRSGPSSRKLWSLSGRREERRSEQSLEARLHLSSFEAAEDQTDTRLWWAGQRLL